MTKPVLQTPSFITESVRKLYEAFPYPHYPLLAKPRWQEGYLASSAFSRVLSGAKSSASAGSERVAVLLAGCGEILPFVARQWEGRDTRLVCLDLSARSLKRARLRLWRSLKPTDFVQADIDDYLDEQNQLYTHINAYGVLHHLANPRATLERLTTRLAPGGTMRLMVYNSPARAWIHEIQRALVDLGLSPYAAEDLAMARSLLEELASISPAFYERLAQVGRVTLTNPTRFADTFMHPREVRLPIRYWFDGIKRLGLQAVGLLDRYAELDDLANPLWQTPDVAALERRASDRRFENNLELFIVKPPSAARKRQETFTAAPLPWVPILRMPPKGWFGYEETRNIPLLSRHRLWNAHLAWIYQGRGSTRDQTFAGLSDLAMQRLARVGAILPGQVASAALDKILRAPLVDAMEVPKLAPATTLTGTRLEATLRRILTEKGGGKEARRLSMVLARLSRAQGR